MEIVVAKRILEELGISRDEFAGMVGVKPVTMRMTFYNGRFSRKALAKLEELPADNFSIRTCVLIGSMRRQLIEISLTQIIIKIYKYISFAF